MRLWPLTTTNAKMTVAEVERWLGPNLNYDPVGRMPIDLGLRIT